MVAVALRGRAVASSGPWPDGEAPEDDAPNKKVKAVMIDTSVLLDGSPGAFVGAVITGAAQTWSCRLGKKDSRMGLSITAAQQLLTVVYAPIEAAKLLPRTAAAGGSRPSYSECLARSADARKAPRQAEFTTVPALTDPQLQRAFVSFAGLFNSAAGADADIDKAAAEAVTFGKYVGECLDARINSKRLPVAPTSIAMPVGRSGQLPPAE